MSKTSLCNLPEATRKLPLGQLHLGLRAYNTLTRAKITNVEDLLVVINDDFTSVLGLGSSSIADILQSLTQLQQVLLENGDIDWIAYCQLRNIQLVPTKLTTNPSPLSIYNGIPNLVKEILCLNQENDRLWKIIQRRFGFEGTQRLTLEQIGEAYGLTRERVRQLQDKALDELREVLIEHQYAGKNYRVHSEILRVISSLSSTLASSIKDFILETELIELSRGIFNFQQKSDIVSLFLLFEVFSMNRIEFDNPNLTPIWSFSLNDQHQRLKLREVISNIDKLLTRDTVTPMEEFDVLLHINQELPKSKKLSLVQLKRLLELCHSIEQREDNLYWGKFEHLKGRANQIERILIEAGQPIRVSDILRTLNKRLVPLGHDRLHVRTIGNQLSDDDRFTSIGKSGLWGLRKWTHIDSSNIVDLIERALITFDRPVSIKEIYAYVKERRPVSEDSILIYLSSKDTFKKVDRLKWGLASWPETSEEKLWTPTQVAEFVTTFFKSCKVKEIEYKTLKQALMAAASVNEKQAQGLLSSNSVIKVTQQGEKDTRIAIYNPDYKDSLNNREKPFSRKKETSLEIVTKAVRTILEAQPGKQLELSKLARMLQEKHSLPEKTVYSYISRLSFIEKINLPGQRIRICRIKGQIGFDFPQLAKIQDTYTRDQAIKAIEKLTVDEVDIGLFLLGRLFEETLKKFMVAVEKAGVYPVTPNNYNKLNNMIDWTKSQNIVTDPTALHFLRQERNNRAHGTAPSTEERQILLNSAGWIVGMYLDYINFFVEQRRKIS